MGNWHAQYVSRTQAFILKFKGKNSSFDCHRRFLDNDHPYRCNRNGFKQNSIEEEEPPVTLNDNQIWERVHLPKITKVGRSIRIPSYEIEHNWSK